MQIGIQGGIADAVPNLETCANLQIQVVRCDVTDATDYHRLAATFQASHSCRALFLIRDVSKAAALLDAVLPLELDCALEVFNEPNINDISVDTYVAGVNQVFSDARSRGFAGRYYAGAIANLNRDGIAFLRAAEPRLSPGIDMAIHRYQPDTQTDLHGHSRRAVPWAPFESREDELQTVRQIIRGRHLAVTEFGYHTATEDIGWFNVKLTDEQVRENLVADFHLYEANGVELAIVYQWNDGPIVSGTGEPIDHFMHRFGITKEDGTVKPQAEAFRLYRESA
jgi:hypothetical protein